MCNFAYFANLLRTNFLWLLTLLILLLIFFLLFVRLFARGLFVFTLLETNFAFVIPIAIATVRQDKALPLCICLQFLDDPLTKYNGRFNLLLRWLEQI